MALGSEKQIYQCAQPHRMLSTRTFYNSHNAHQRSIAPALSSLRTSSAPYSKSPPHFTGTTLDSNNPSVIRRNARERNRVKQVNNGFLNLRQHIPAAIVADLSNGRRGIGPGANKKLSKVDTLRMALEYIRLLRGVIDDVDNSDCSSVSSYGTCFSTTSAASSPQSLSNMDRSSHHLFQTSQYFSTISYSGAIQTQQSHMTQQNHLMTSPVGSVSSTSSNSHNSYDRFYATQTSSHNQRKVELNYDNCSNTSTDDDEELLDYISLWQDDM